MLVGIDASRATSPQRTGTENYSLHLIRHLLAFKDQRYRLYFNAAPPPGLFPQSDNWEARVIPFPRLWTHLRLSWEMVRRPPNLLFVPAHVIPLIHPRSVVTVHDLGYLYHPGAHRAWDRLYLDLSTRFNASVASQIIADSEATKNDLVQKYHLSEERITVVYPGCNLEPVIDETGWERVRERYHLPDKYILHLGTLHPRKNILRLLEAFQSLVRDFPDLHLVLAGKRGWLYEEILYKAEGLGGRVHFPGYIASEDLPALMRGARLFILPSLYEGFGFPILEAMAAGTPVVCSNASALPEVAGDAALLVDPHDVEAMRETTRRVLEDEALRAELVERGLERAKIFSWERCARETLSVLKKVAGSDGRKG